MADGDTRGDGCDEYSASVRNSLSFLEFLFFFQNIKKKNSHAVFPHRNSSFFLFFSFLSYIHVTFGIPRRSAFTSQENVSPSWASITFAFFNPSSPTAFLPKWPPKTAPSPPPRAPPRAAPKAAFATSPAPIFPIGFLVIAIVWAPASIGITYACFAALNFCGSCHLYTDRKTPVALRRRGLLRLSTNIFRYNYILFPAVLSSISLRSISVGLSPYKFSD